MCNKIKSCQFTQKRNNEVEQKMFLFGYKMLKVTGIIDFLSCYSYSEMNYY